MEKRAYGATGIDLSIIGFGGIIVDKVSTKEAAAHVAEAYDAGINYFDVAPTYGNAQEMLGPALKPYRDKVFLACKTGKRTAAEGQAELEESLRLLETEHFDLYQLHAMTTEEDFQTAMGPGGVMEMILKAKEKGQIRYVGFSAHSAEIAVRLLDAFDFASVLTPLNFASIWNGGFGPQIMDKAQEKGAAFLALKAMARTHVPEGEKRPNPRCWYEPIPETDMAQLALRFTLGQPVTAAIPPGDIELFRIALAAVKDGFKPLTAAEEQSLRAYAKNLDPLFAAASR